MTLSEYCEIRRRLWHGAKDRLIVAAHVAADTIQVRRRYDSDFSESKTMGELVYASEFENWAFDWLYLRK